MIISCDSHIVSIPTSKRTTSKYRIGKWAFVSLVMRTVAPERDRCSGSKLVIYLRVEIELGSFFFKFTSVQIYLVLVGG